MELRSKEDTQQDVYEEFENNNQQELYTNIPDIKQQSYLELENDIPQEEYTGVREGKSKPQLLPRKSDRIEEPPQEIYENAEVSYQSQKKTKDKGSRNVSEPRYTSSPVKPVEPETVLYVNQSEARRSLEDAEKEKPKIKPKSTKYKIETPLPGKSKRKMSLTINKSLKTRYIFIIILIIAVAILVFFAIFFPAGWFGRGDSKNEVHHLNTEPCMFQLPKLDDKLVWCGEKEIEIISATQPETSLTAYDKNRLLNMAQDGLPLRVAYRKKISEQNNTWLYADVNHVSQFTTEEMCVQLYETYTSVDLLGTGTSLAMEWTSVCTDGVINVVIYAIGTGKPLKAIPYKSEVKWIIHKHKRKVVYKDSFGMNLSYNQSILKDYISSGSDISVRYDNQKRLTGYLSGNVIYSSANNITIAQFMDLSIHNCSDTCYFNYQKDSSKSDYILWMQPSTIANLNWDIMRYTVESHNSRGHVPDFFNSTWSVDPCWKSVYEHMPGQSDSDGTLKQLLYAIRLGHRVRVVIQEAMNSFVNFEPSLLIIKNNHLYGLHIWKAKLNDTEKTKIDANGMWEWTIISTNGKYITQYCDIGNNNCQNATLSNFKSVKWSIDSYTWTPIYQQQFPEMEAMCGNTNNLVNNVLAGKAIKYSVTDLESNTEYFHQAHHVHLKGSTEVIIEHMNEVLLQWDQNGDIQFASLPTMIHRQLSSSGNMLQQMWPYGSDRPVTSAAYNYLTGNTHNITWFA